MAKTATKKTVKRATPPSARRKRGGFPCPKCDFVAKHAMGLGRHRSAIHGTKSKRAVALSKRGGSSARGDKRVAELARTVAALEKKFDRLATGLERLAASARR